MRSVAGWYGMALFSVLSPVSAQSNASCVSAQQHAATEARVEALTQKFDAAKLSRDLVQAGEDQQSALDALQTCQKNSILGVGCGWEIDAYILAEKRNKMFAQQVDMYRALSTTQANARASELPVCR